MLKATDAYYSKKKANGKKQMAIEYFFMIFSPMRTTNTCQK